MGLFDENKDPLQYKRICPKCGSTDVWNDFSNGAAVDLSVIVYVCKKCGYQGRFFPEVESQKTRAFKKEREEAGTPQAEAPREFEQGYLTYAGYILGTFLIIMGVISIVGGGRQLGYVYIVLGLFFVWLVLRRSQSKPPQAKPAKSL